MSHTYTSKQFESLKALYWDTIELASGRLSWNADWMQEACIILLNLHSSWDFSGEEHFETALYATIQKAANEYHYDNVTKHHRTTDFKEPTNAVEAFELTTEYLDREIDLKWFKKRVKELLKKHLNDKEYKIIHAYFYQGKTQDQIATSLGLTQGRVAQIVSEILERLKSSPEFENLWVLSKELL